MFDQYLQVISKVDQTVAQLEAKHSDHLVCKAGCDACCQFNLSFYPVEVAYAAHSLKQREDSEQADILGHLREYKQGQADSPCPLLVNGCCLLYEARPLLCRTHGLLLDISDSPQEQQVERSCELNYPSLEGIDLSESIRQALLSKLLYQINGLFTQTVGIDANLRCSMLDIPDFL